MPLFSDNFRALVQGEQSVQVQTVVDFEFPAGAGGTIRVSGSLISYALARLASVGAVSIGLTERPSDLAAQSTAISVIDTDFLFSKILRGRYNARRSPVTIWWAHESLAEADWFPVFTGIIDDWKVRAALVEFHATTDNRALQGDIPKKQILKGTFLGAPDTSIGIYAPIVLGVHNAQGLTGTGMLPAIPVSIDATLGYRYMVSLGTLADIPRVYKNGTLQTLTTHYTLDLAATSGGLTYSEIAFVSATTASDVITCDVEGLTEDGLSTGPVILNPADQLKWMLHNLIYSDWDGGAYSTTAAPIDSPAFAAAASYATAFGYEGARYLGGTTSQIRADSEVNEWLKSHLMFRARWNNTGEIGVKSIDHRFTPYPSDFRPDDSADEVTSDPWTFDTSANGIIASVSLEYLYDTVSSKYWQTLQVQDLERWQTEKVTESFPLRWSASRFQ